MNIDPTIVKRFEELISQGKSVLSTKERVAGISFVNNVMSGQWSVSSLDFLKRVMGEDGEHYKRFFTHSKNSSRYHEAESAFSVLLSAYDVYKNGHLLNVKRAVTADVFDDFMEQAEYHLASGYFPVAAVTAGAVLEDSLRRLCAHHSITLSAKPKLDSMNSELVRAGVYDIGIQKQITAFAHTRNSAAHGKWKEFTEDDTKLMIEWVKRFVKDHIP